MFFSSTRTMGTHFNVEHDSQQSLLATYADYGQAWPQPGTQDTYSSISSNMWLQDPVDRTQGGTYNSYNFRAQENPDYNQYKRSKSIQIGNGLIIANSPYTAAAGNVDGRACVFGIDGQFRRILLPYDNASGFTNALRGSWTIGQGVIIGGNQDNTAERGRMDLYNLNGERMQTVQRGRSFYDHWGWSVAIGDSRIVWGAPGRNTLGSGFGGDAHGPGAIAIFDYAGSGRNNYMDQYQTYYIAQIENNDQGYIPANSTEGVYAMMGHDVAVGCGRIVAGAPGYRTAAGNGYQTGAIYIFDLNGVKITKIIGGTSANKTEAQAAGGGVANNNVYTSSQIFGNTFGMCVDIGHNMIVVGDPNAFNQKGAVYVYDLNGNYIGYRKGTTAGDLLGMSVAIGEGRIIAGAPQTHFPGPSVGSSSSGYVEVLRLPSIYQTDSDANGSLTLETTLTPNINYTNGGFGQCVAIGEGKIAVSYPAGVKAVTGVSPSPRHGSIHLFDTYKMNTHEDFALNLGMKTDMGLYNENRLDDSASYTNRSGSFTLTGYISNARASELVEPGGSIFIDSASFLYSDDSTQPGLLIDTDNITVTNAGVIMGRGGNGGSEYLGDSNGRDGGPAIKIEPWVTGTTIINRPGGYIAGGGGGGSGKAGGGGAGGGHGGVYNIMMDGLDSNDDVVPLTISGVDDTYSIAGEALRGYGTGWPNEGILPYSKGFSGWAVKQGNPSIPAYPRALGGDGGGAGGYFYSDGTNNIWGSAGWGGRDVSNISDTGYICNAGTHGYGGAEGKATTAGGTGCSAGYWNGGGGGYGQAGSASNSWASGSYTSSGGASIEGTSFLIDSGTMYGVHTDTTDISY
jgi:hypothetical protein